MPKLKDPIVSSELFEDSLGNILSKADYGEFNPVQQLRQVSDLEKGGEFVGVDYTLEIDQTVAKIALSYMYSLKPNDRESKSADLMKCSVTADKFFGAIKESIGV